MLDYGYTCPTIDDCISSVESHVKGALEHLCTFKEPEDYIKDTLEEIIDEVTYQYDLVRSTNEDMREAADSQIAELQGVIEEKENNLSYMEAKLEEALQTIKDLEDELCQNE